MSKMLHWLSLVAADLTSATPPRGAPEDRDWMPSTIACTGSTSPHFLAMVGRYAGWYRERHGPDTSPACASKARALKE